MTYPDPGHAVGVAVNLPEPALGGVATGVAGEELANIVAAEPSLFSMCSFSKGEPLRAGRAAHDVDQRTTERATRNPTSSTWKVGWLRRRAEARQLQCSSNQPPPRSTR